MGQRQSGATTFISLVPVLTLKAALPPCARMAVAARHAAVPTARRADAAIGRSVLRGRKARGLGRRALFFNGADHDAAPAWPGSHLRGRCDTRAQRPARVDRATPVQSITL